MEETPEPELSTDESPAEVTRFPVEPFVAKGGGTPGRFLVVWIVGLAISAVLIFLATQIASFATAVFIFFPICLGALVGLGVGIVGYLARTRSGKGSMTVFLIGLLCGTFAYCGFHYAYHLSGSDPDAVAGESFQQSLERRATKGYVLKGKRGGKTNFGYTGTWIYWAIVWGITSLFAGVIASSITRGPYCEICDKWNRKRNFGPFPFDAVAGHQAFLAGEPTLMFVPGPSNNKVALAVYDCPSCPNDPLSIKYTGTIGSGKTMKTHSAFLVYPHSALPAFEAIELIANQSK